MVRRVCKGCAELTAAGVVGYVITRLIRRRREETVPHGFFRRLVMH
jgi:hypothetical protein